MPFLSRFNCSSRPYESIEYRTVVPVLSYDKKARDVVVVGSKNLQAFINAPAPECGVYRKIERFLNGDINALGGGSQKAIYTDVSGMPTDINSIHQLIRDVNSKINALGHRDIPSFLDMLHNASNSNSDHSASVVENPQNESEVNNNA